MTVSFLFFLFFFCYFWLHFHFAPISLGVPYNPHSLPPLPKLVTIGEKILSPNGDIIATRGFLLCYKGQHPNHWHYGLGLSPPPPSPNPTQSCQLNSPLAISGSSNIVTFLSPMFFPHPLIVPNTYAEPKNTKSEWITYPASLVIQELRQSRT